VRAQYSGRGSLPPQIIIGSVRWRRLYDSAEAAIAAAIEKHNVRKVDQWWLIARPRNVS
jgi:hypothetical protein